MQQAAANMLTQNRDMAYVQYKQNAKVMSNKMKNLNQGNYRKPYGNNLSKGEGEMPSFDNLPMMN